MTAAFRAGVVYFAAIFALGFVLGTFRVLVLVPRFNETNAVLLESPIILGAAWFLCRYLTKKFAVKAALPARLFMGAAAFAFLMAAEQLLGIFVFGRNFDALILHYQTSAGAIGLAGQIIFAFFPAIQLLIAERR